MRKRTRNIIIIAAGLIIFAGAIYASLEYIALDKFCGEST